MAGITKSKASLKVPINSVQGVPLLKTLVLLPPCINGVNLIFSFLTKPPIPLNVYILCPEKLAKSTFVKSTFIFPIA